MKVSIEPLANHCDLITKGTTPTSLGFDFSDNGVPFLRVGNISGGLINYKADTLFISHAVNDALKRSKILPKDVLLSIAGSIGRAGVVPDDAPLMNCNQAVAILRTKNSICRQYLRHWLESQQAQTQIKGVTVTGTIQNLSLSQVGALKVPLPPLPEQRRIAAILDQADALRAKRREALAQLDTLTQSIFVEMFGDPVKNPKNWKVGTIDEALKKEWLVDLQDGNHGEKHPKVSDFSHDGIPFIMANCLVNGELDINKAYKLDTGWLKYLRIGFAKANDLLLSHKGTVGELAIVPSDCDIVILSPQTTYYRVSEKLNVVFLKGFFGTRWFQSILQKEAIQSTRAYIGITRQKLLPMIFPPIELQNEYASKVAMVKAVWKANAAAESNLQELFESLQHRAFRGEL